MICLSCRHAGPPLCETCRRSVRPTGETATPDGWPVWSWAVHEGAPRMLVRRLKYEAVTAVAVLAAHHLGPLVPPEAAALVPVPRTIPRRVRFGIDPAVELAAALAARSGVPMVRALSPPMWARANAGHRRDDRRPPAFRRRTAVEGAVVVDDVMTTGATIDAAAATLGGILGAVTVSKVP